MSAYAQLSKKSQKCRKWPKNAEAVKIFPKIFTVSGILVIFGQKWKKVMEEGLFRYSVLGVSVVKWVIFFGAKMIGFAFPYEVFRSAEKWGKKFYF